MGEAGCRRQSPDQSASLCPRPHSGPGWWEPGPVWGDDREDDREAGPAVQRLWLLLWRWWFPLARGPDGLVSGRPSRETSWERGGAGTPSKWRLTSPLSPFEPWAPRQPLAQPSLAHGPLQVARDPSRCCHAHDCCYGRLEKLGCEPKLERYLFSASRHNIFCGK